MVICAITAQSKEGLLNFVDWDQNGNRIFKESDFERLFIIASLKRASMSIKQIREFTKLCDESDSTIARRLTDDMEQWYIGAVQE